MPEIESIGQIARHTLTGSSRQGDGGNWLWDRTLRILRNAEHISRLPELAQKANAIDRSCLMTAVYFSESGSNPASAVQKNVKASNSGDTNDPDVSSRSIQIVSKQLAGVISEARIDKVNTIITESASRFTDMIEAMILSDARNLEDMGIVGLFHEFRRNTLQGKSVSDLLDSWKCKIEYGYWQARIKESFRFEGVRHVAQQRLSAATSMMEHLAAENDLTDIEDQLIQLLSKSK